MSWRIPALSIVLPLLAAGAIAHGRVDRGSETERDNGLSASLETPDRVPQPPTSEWMVGVWLHDASLEDVSREACNSGTVQSYEADGRWSFFEGVGRWTLADGVLTSTVSEMDETSYVNDQDYTDRDAEIEIGKPYGFPIRRIGPHEGALLTEGKWRLMLRCRAQDFNVQDQMSR